MIDRAAPQFLFDFGSPNAYLAHRVIPSIEARTGVRFEYVPVLLGGLFKLANNRSPMEAFAGIPSKMAYERMEMQRFIRHHRLSAFQFNPHFPVNTLHIMRGAVAAQQLGCLAPYVEAVYVAMWERGLKMDDPAVIGPVLAEAGLDAAALMAASQSAEVKAQLMAHTQQAHERGAFGSPTFFVGPEMYFGKDRLGEVEAQIVRSVAVAAGAVPVAGLAHLGIRVHDLARSMAFYELLGFHKTAGPIGPEPVAILRHPSGVEINLVLNAAQATAPNVLMDGPDKHPGITHFALLCHDLAAAQARLAEAGIPLSGGPQNLGGLAHAIFVRDPDRNVVELHQPI